MALPRSKADRIGPCTPDCRDRSPICRTTCARYKEHHEKALKHYEMSLRENEKKLAANEIGYHAAHKIKRERDRKKKR